ncbi:unnamed protein product [Arabidopsis halleri]
MTTTLPTSFSSLPEDIILSCLARVSKFCRPTLSLVSKYFRSLVASPDLEATRSRNGITEDYLCVCLNVGSKPRWFTLAPFPQQQKLKPIPPFPYCRHPESSTVVSIGSEIYIIGGSLHQKKGNRVLVLDCRSHQWRRLPNMRLARETPAADVIDGKIYVLGGSTSHKIENWGEVYDLKTKTWEPLLPKTLNLTTQKSVVPGKLVMGGKVYAMNDGLMKLNLMTNICLVEIENIMFQISISNGMLVWFNPEENLGWSMGLEGVPRDPYFPSYLTSVASYDRGRRVTVWWKLTVSRCIDPSWVESKTEICCAEISFERRDLGKLWGFVEWSKNVFIFDGSASSDFFLHSAIVTY